MNKKGLRVDMSRLTKKYDERYDFSPSNFTENNLGAYNTELDIAIDKMLLKLGQIEDIEEELGIDLITFHKALKNGVYYKVTSKESPNYGKIFFDEFILWGWERDEDGNYFAMMQSQCQLFVLKEYGKTWALTKEELL